jgi:hypothetical protein
LGLNLSAAWWTLALTVPLYFSLYAYLDLVLPNKNDKSKPCCFCVRRTKKTQVVQSLAEEEQMSFSQNGDTEQPVQSSRSSTTSKKSRKTERRTLPRGSPRGEQSIEGISVSDIPELR